MQHPLRTIIGFGIRATDGDLGKVDEFFFDDQSWITRYLVAETGSWLAGRKVLISLQAMGHLDWESHTISVNLSCAQVRTSPDVDTQRPVYRQHEVDLFKYYQWSPYWEGGYGGVLGVTPFPLLDEPLVQESSAPQRHDDPHLRSTHHVIGYQIHATDGEIGHVHDFVVDDEGWAIRHLVVETGSWLSGKKVLVPVAWIKGVSWEESSVRLDRTRKTVESCPEFDPSKTIHRELVGE